MRKALVVGIDDYPCSPLYGCVNDAISVGELLRTNGDGSPNFDVSLKTNIKTKDELLYLIEQLFSGYNEVSLLYFSGHGSEQGHLVTPDYKRKDLGVNMSEVLEYANKSKSRNKIIILDCCYSGQFGEGTSMQSKEWRAAYCNQKKDGRITSI